MTRPASPIPWIAVVAVALLFAGGGCSATIEQIGGHQVRLFSASVRLHGHALPLHVSSGFAGRTPLLLYATGDAGWLGRDVELFNKLVPAGYPVVGFSARFYLSHLHNGRSQESPDDLAKDYATIADAALAALHLPPETPLLLVGKSRGADLAVVAASDASLKPRVAGILAVALTAEEEYVSPLAGRSLPHPAMVHPYQMLPSLTAISVIVIQSTTDQYLPAADARGLFGPDTADRRFRPITAADHSFDGALDVLYDEVAQGLRWLMDAITARAKGGAAPAQS
jgi:hypothetical protein